MTCVIEKNVPIVEAKTGRPKGCVKYPLDKMEPGDSFIVPFDDCRRVSTYISRYGRENNKVFSRRRVPEGYRVWRIA